MGESKRFLRLFLCRRRADIDYGTNSLRLRNSKDRMRGDRMRGHSTLRRGCPDLHLPQESMYPNLYEVSEPELLRVNGR